MMLITKLFPILFLFVFCSCDQIIGSLAKEKGNTARIKDSLAFLRTEQPVAADTFNIIERKKVGNDSFFLVRSYFLDGTPYYDSWHRNQEPHGLTTFYFNSGKIQYTVEYKNGHVFAVLNSYDQNGNKIDGGSLKNGTGDLKVYHPVTGSLIYKTEYKNGLKHGAYASFYSDGKKQEEANFKNDTLNGNYVKYFHSGNLNYKGVVKVPNQTGSYDYYYENGKLNKHDEWANGKQIAYDEYDEKGFLIKSKKMVGGDLIGTISYYNDEGILLSKGSMVNDRKHGKFETYYSAGKIKSLEVYSNDTLLTEKTWYANGVLSSESFYKDGLKTGIYKEYYVTGHIRSEQVYVKGMKEGVYKSYFDNGVVYNDGQFKNDSLTGDLKFYSKEGKLTRTKKYN